MRTNCSNQRNCLYLDEFTEIRPDTLSQYIKDFKTKAACERYTEKLIEAMIDLAFLSIREKGLVSPENDLQAFDILSKHKIIPPALTEKLKDAKRMRNILAHEYGEVDDEIVFNSIHEELERDVKDFINAIKKT